MGNSNFKSSSPSFQSVVIFTHTPPLITHPSPLSSVQFSSKHPEDQLPSLNCTTKCLPSPWRSSWETSSLTSKRRLPRLVILSRNYHVLERRRASVWQNAMLRERALFSMAERCKNHASQKLREIARGMVGFCQRYSNYFLPL